MMKRIVALLGLLFAAIAACAQSLPDFTELVEKQGPAVVNISSTHIVKNNTSVSPFPFDESDPSFEFFRRFLPRPQPGVPRDFKSESLGSGFIVSADGYILTNAHVVDAADEVQVRLTDKREFKAKVIGADRRTDVALIKIEAVDLPVVRLGDPGRLKVGEWVIAIGSPFGFDNSVTAGIVSAKGRSLPQENFVPFIQTDVAINPGNSGGPLFNMQGEVVGINSQIYSRSGGYMGLSFAIPIDVAMDVQKQLRASGRVSRGRIGVVIQEITKELADAFGLEKSQGALVATVEKGGPGDKAGIEAGDVILQFDGKMVERSSDLPRIVAAVKPGSPVPALVWRQGATKTLTVVVGEWLDDTAVGARPKGKETKPAVNRLGLVLNEVPAERRQQLGVDHGLVVEEVAAGSRSGLRQGDLLLALIYQGVRSELKSVAQFDGLLAKIDKAQSLTLLVRRGDNQTFLTIKGGSDK